jgi:hypothetical protein
MSSNWTMLGQIDEGALKISLRVQENGKAILLGVPLIRHWYCEEHAYTVQLRKCGRAIFLKPMMTPVSTQVKDCF